MNTPSPYNEALGATLIDRSVREKIVLVGVALPGTTEEAIDASLDELELLVDTAGADVAGRLVQRRDAPDHTWYIGKGKVEELKELCLAVDADTVVFDNELAPAQQFNLEKQLGRTAIDRTAVILDIFGQNAHTLEGKAQVELALLRYRLPRLRRGKDANLSQQRGGVGARFGGGETKMEVDRRRIMRRITKLESDLQQLADTRALQRKGRGRSGLANVAIVGYTNAGKSTLLNRLTDAGVLSEDRLFATLDPTTRRLALPGGEPVLLTDTVGFVRNLPHGLVEAFKGTLEVASRADYLVHVVDSSAPDPRGQIDAVRTVLAEIDAERVPELLVFNKADLEPGVAKQLVADHVGSVAVSAATGEGTDTFLRTLSDRLRALTNVIELAIPYERGDVLAAVHREGEVVSTTESEAGYRVRARLSDASAGRLAEFVTSGDTNGVRHHL
ncbi:MAG TPA: GTPase HflX [Ilumatobacter sp.]|nr:GTPase HflX [Ilumatobacter sp.]